MAISNFAGTEFPLLLYLRVKNLLFYEKTIQNTATTVNWCTVYIERTLYWYSGTGTRYQGTAEYCTHTTPASLGIPKIGPQPKIGPPFLVLGVRRYVR